MAKKIEPKTSDYDKITQEICEEEISLKKKIRQEQKKERQEEKFEKEKLKREKIQKKISIKKAKKEAWAMKKRRNAKTKLPKTVQQSIPYIADYDGGLFEIAPNVYSKCIDFSDVNYHIAGMEDQINIFVRWGEFLNSFGSDVEMSYTINNKPVNVSKLLDEIKINPIEGLEEATKEFNVMLYKQFMIGRNDIQKERYITISIHADNPYDAMQRFAKIETEIINSLARLGSVARVQSTERRLSILHDFYRHDNVGELHLDWNNIKMQGISAKDFIAPDGMLFKSDSIRIGEMWYKCAYLNNLPSSLVDTILHDLTDFSFPLMCTVSVQTVEMDKAVRLVKRQLTGMEANKIEAQKKAIKAGFDPELSITHELRQSLEEAELLLQSIQTQNQKLFFSTICFLIGGKTENELKENQITLNTAVRSKLCQLQVIRYQQEEALKQILPLGHNVLPLKRTLTTESLGVFIPFTSQELNDKDGVYCSLNKITNRLIRVNPKMYNNPNGFILGETGSGKSFFVKKEILATYLSRPEEKIFIIDPEGEYVRFVKELGGQVVEVGVGRNNYINICDMAKNYSLLKGDPIAEKVDFLLSVCECMARGLNTSQMSIIDHVAGLMYREFLQDYDEAKVPTFESFYKKLAESEEQEAKELALALRSYATGSLSIFAKKTNVDLDNRLVCFDISHISTNLRDVGLLVISEYIWNTLCSNRNKISTSIYIDEIQDMFKNKASENFAEQLFARVRKYGGKVRGLTQNVDKLLQSEIARGMLSNTSFTVMLNQSDTNRKILADMFSISKEQLSYITNADKGEGLIRAGGTIVPFGDCFPKDLKIYRYMTSDPDEIKAFTIMEEEERLLSEKKALIQSEREKIKEMKDSETAHREE